MSNLRTIIKEILVKHLDKTLVLKEDVKVSKHLRYHINRSISLTDNHFKSYSQEYFDFINEVRRLWNEDKINLNYEDKKIIESDLGIKVKIGKNYVYLDAPYILETQTGKNIIGESKHFNNNRTFAVYTKSKSGGVTKVLFGNKGLKLLEEKNKCLQNKDRTTPGYWNCSIGRHLKQLGLSN